MLGYCLFFLQFHSYTLYEIGYTLLCFYSDGHLDDLGLFLWALWIFVLKDSFLHKKRKFNKNMQRVTIPLKMINVNNSVIKNVALK